MSEGFVVNPKNKAYEKMVQAQNGFATLKVTRDYINSQARKLQETDDPKMIATLKGKLALRPVDGKKVDVQALAVAELKALIADAQEQIIVAESDD